MSLRWRLTAVIGGVVAVMLFSASLLAYLSAESELNRQVNEFLLNRSRETEEGLVQATNLPDRSIQALGFQQGTFGAIERADANIQILLPDASTALLLSGSRLPITEEDVAIAMVQPGGPTERAIFDRSSSNGDTYRVLVSSNPRGALMVGRSINDVNQTLDGLRGWLIVISGFGSLAAAFVGWLVADRVLRPVARLAAATEQVAETRRFDADIRVESTDELGALAGSFNTMLSALRSSREQQDRLVRDANHELRTPLTSLRTNVDVLRRRGEQLDQSQRSELVEQMDGEVRELTELVTELVTSATNTGSLAPDTFVELDLVELVGESVRRTRRRTGRQIDMTGESVAIVRGDGDSLARAIGNLIGNAVKFSPSGSPILVHVDEASVTVCDRGPGIAEDELERVFDRFYRSDATRTLPGSGLGLSIVADIAAAHGGEAQASAHHGGGACVGFSVATLHKCDKF